MITSQHEGFDFDYDAGRDLRKRLAESATPSPFTPGTSTAKVVGTLWIPRPSPKDTFVSTPADEQMFRRVRRRLVVRAFVTTFVLALGLGLIALLAIVLGGER